MSQQRQLGPITLRFAGDGWRIILPTSDELEPEMPPDLERTLTSGFAQFFAKNNNARLLIDLNGVPAISSHQLGLMLAVQKSVRAQLGKVPVVGVSENVRRLLDVTNTAQFFEIQTAPA